MKDIIHYRYEGRLIFEGFLFEIPAVIKLYTYNLVSETRCGYWIKTKGIERFVLKESRKRYAYPTKIEAWYNFKVRTDRRINLLNQQISIAKAIRKEISKREELEE